MENFENFVYDKNLSFEENENGEWTFTKKEFKNFLTFLEFEDTKKKYDENKCIYYILPKKYKNKKSSTKISSSKNEIDQIRELIKNKNKETELNNLLSEENYDKDYYDKNEKKEVYNKVKHGLSLSFNREREISPLKIKRRPSSDKIKNKDSNNLIRLSTENLKTMSFFFIIIF